MSTPYCFACCAQLAVLEPEFQNHVKEEACRLHSELMDIPEPIPEEEIEIEVAMDIADMEPDEWAEQGILAEGPELEVGQPEGGQPAPEQAQAAPESTEDAAAIALRHEAWCSLNDQLQNLPIRHRPNATPSGNPCPLPPTSASQPCPEPPSHNLPHPSSTQPSRGNRGRGPRGGRTRDAFRGRSWPWEPAGQEHWRRRPGRGVQFVSDSEETEVVVLSQDSADPSVGTPVPPSDRELRPREEARNLCETDTEHTDQSDEEEDYATLLERGQE